MSAMIPVTLAALIGGWELLVIAAIFIFPIAAVAFGLSVFLFLRSRSRRKAAVPPTPAVIPNRRLSRTCPQCGAALKPDAPEGLCPACLLQHGIATEGGAPPGTPPFIPPTL